MAKSISWTSWIHFPIVRERTLWLAAAAARSAIAFGAEVVDRYVDVLGRATHVTQLFDALFGLTAIGLSDRNCPWTASLLVDIAAEENVATRRLMIDAEFAEAGYRSAMNCLSLSEGHVPDDHDFLDRLSWRPASLRGLARRGFRLTRRHRRNPANDRLPRAAAHSSRQNPIYYPVRPRAHAPLLPALEEMPGLPHARLGDARPDPKDDLLDGQDPLRAARNATAATPQLME